MKYLFKNYAPYKKIILLIFLLVVGQAYCDMEVPTYTADLIDVGIQNGGVEHILPEQICSEEYFAVRLFMTDEEKEAFDAAYESDGDKYVRTLDDEEALDELDETLIVPIVISYQLQTNSDATNSSASSASDLSDMAGASGASAASDMAGAFDLSAMRKELDKTIDTIGSQTLNSMGIAWARQCDEKAGMDMEKIQNDYMWRCGGKMLLITVVMVVFAAVVSYLSAKVGANIGRTLRKRVFNNIMAYSSSEMDKFQTSSLITRATNDIQQVQMVSTMMLRMVLLAPVMAGWGIIKVAQTKAHMNLVVVLSTILLLLLISILMVIAMPKFKIMQSLVDKLNGVSREILTGIPVIRAFCREKNAEERFDKANTELMKTQLYVNRVMTFLFPVMMVVLYGTTIVITWVGAERIDAGTLNVGAMTAFITYTMMVITSFLILAGMSIILPRAGVAAERINEVLETTTKITDAENAIELKDCKGLVRFNNVSFRYSNADEDVVKNIDFEARPGETTALIGSTGCGKTTIVNLIPRFYDVTEGSITIDGIDIRDYSIKSIRDAIGYVPQKGVLFSGTIASNIRFGNKDATDEELREFAQIAQAEDFIEEKDDKYESFISQGGTNVSGGQKQRLSIARALAKRPAILIFDDSFSALDMKTDANLRKELADKCSDATKIIVAQRVGTILHAEQIIVLDDGEIVGKGTHKELMESCAVYRQIAESQLSQMELEGM